MKLPTCDKCTRNASWRRPWDNRKLCRLHFNKAFIYRVQRTINKHKLFNRTDRIIVGLSGGKDSVVLMNVLAEIERKHPVEMIAVTVDEGITHYREDGLKYAKMAAENAGVEHIIYSFEERFGATLDTTLEVLGDKRMGACSYCGIFRRKLLNEAALSLNADKLATGHNADDEAQTVLMNLVRGDLMKVFRSNPNPTKNYEGFVRRVKPFRWTTEQEIVLYAHFNEILYQEMQCPNSVEAQRGVIRNILQELQEHTPDVIFSILRSADSLLRIGDLLGDERKEELPDIFPREGRFCAKCGQPSTKRICRGCIIKEEILERVKESKN